MALWYNVQHRDPNPTGKFQHRRRIGTQPSGDSRYRGYTYQLIQHRTGSAVERNVFNVSVKDGEGEVRQYLRDFGSPDRAVAAAKQWIDTAL